MLAFRHRLRSNDADAQLYERTKRDSRGGRGDTCKDSADAKTDVVEEIMARVRPTSSGSAPDPT